MKKQNTEGWNRRLAERSKGKLDAGKLFCRLEVEQWSDLMEERLGLLDRARHNKEQGQIEGLQKD